MLVKFCFCVPLRIGVFVTAVLGILFNIAIFIVSILLLCGKLPNYRNHFENDYVDIDIWHTVLIIVSILNVLVDIMLIIGAAKNLLYLFIPWLVMNTFAMLLTFIVMMMGLYIKIFSMAFINLFLLGVQLYFYLVVYSYFKTVWNDLDDDVF